MDWHRKILRNKEGRRGQVQVDVVIVLYKPGDFERRLIQELPRKTETSHIIRVFDNSRNAKNPSMAYNDLVFSGTAPYIAILHSDVLVSSGWEIPLIKHLEENPTTGAAVSNPGRWDQLGKEFVLGDPPTDRELEAWGSWAHRNMAGKSIPWVTPGECAVFFSVVMRRPDYTFFQGFDERLRFVGNNHEFQWRLHEKGLRTVMVHSSSVYHKDAASFHKAIKGGEFVADQEGAHWEKWKALIRTGREQPWHKLTDEERRDVRNHPEFLIGGPV